jgi:hypothetical protein
MKNVLLLYSQQHHWSLSWARLIQSNPFFFTYVIIKNVSKFGSLSNISQKKVFFRWGAVSPMLNPQSGGPPLVCYPWLLIQYIRSYPLSLEAVFSILNLRTRHATVTRDPLNAILNLPIWENIAEEVTALEQTQSEPRKRRAARLTVR